MFIMSCLTHIDYYDWDTFCYYGKLQNNHSSWFQQQSLPCSFAESIVCCLQKILECLNMYCTETEEYNENDYMQV